ncbi:MAG: Gfo/Idh/MocA family oxidoreductase [Rhodospirillales bacterium]|nr:Gfo/Idh/MocA family oxidoreductase [Rhodospirillales bacterium]
MHDVALLGAGLIGREHAQLLGRHPRLRISVVSDPSPEAEKYAATLGVPWTADYRDALDKFAPAAAIVAVPNQLHVEVGIACLARKVTALIEKPVTDNLADAERLLDAERKNATPILVGHQRRHSPDMQRAKALVGDGTIGRLVIANGMWFVRKHDSYFEQEWRRQPGGGPLWINLIHEIDCLRYVCGEIASVFATSTNRNRNFGVEDTAAITINFANGALGTFAMSDSVPSPFVWDVASSQALYFPHQPGDCFFFGGTKGTLSVPSLDMWTYENDGDWRSRLVKTHMGMDRGACYVRQLDNLADVLESRASPLVSGLEGAKTVAAIVAIEKSAREKRPVALEEVSGPIRKFDTPGQ